MKKKYAIFIDGDNIKPSYLESILTAVLKDGDVHIKRLYGDWTTSNMKGWKEWLEKVSIRPVQQFRNGPNATDNAIIMDAIEIANSNKNINAICIVSTDSDYYSLALRLREYGLYVLGIGKTNSKPLWVKSCNEFKYIENLDEISSDDIENGSEDKKTIISLLTTAYKNSNKTEDAWVNLAELGRTIRNIMPDFDIATYQHNTLRELIESLKESFDLKKDDSHFPNYWFKPKDKKRKE